MQKQDIFNLAKELGYSPTNGSFYDLCDWLRESHEIHVEVGSIWDELNNRVEAKYYTITAPVNVYYSEPKYESRDETHIKMLASGVYEALLLLKQYKQQKNIKVNDDQLVIAYLKGYGDKKYKNSGLVHYKTNVEAYAYRLGKQGDYIEEGLTDEDIVSLVRNRPLETQPLSLQE